jgi:D-inositol-3-phosphate glycosyltransferase
VASQVQFTGRRGRDVLKYYYSAADVFVTLPWYEPFGITPLEAMACGTPVIGANVGGIKFSVRDAETGYLIPPRDGQALADRLAHLFRHTSLRESFGRQGIRRVHALFTWEHVVSTLMALFEEVLAGRRSDGMDRRHEASIIDDSFREAMETMEESRLVLGPTIAKATDIIAGSFGRHGKLLIAGNGGSAAEAQHLAAEFVGRFKARRPGLPAIALTADSAVMTAWSNDFGFEDVFARQVEALGEPGDVLIGLSTSGRSPNLVRAFEAARRHGLRTVALLGGSGGDILPLADVAVVVPSADTQRIQEVHGVLIHVLTELVERRLVARGGESDLEPGRHARRTSRHHSALAPQERTLPIREDIPA